MTMRVTRRAPKDGTAARPRATSSSVAIITATAFVTLAALLSFVDDHADRSAEWQLRGTIAPRDAPDRAAQLPAAPKHV